MSLLCSNCGKAQLKFDYAYREFVKEYRFCKESCAYTWLRRMIYGKELHEHSVS